MDSGREHLDPELDALLRRSRPTPDAWWLRDLEAQLLPDPSRRWARWRLPHVRVAAAFAAGLAMLLVALTLAGVGPLGDQTRDVRADEDCHMTLVTKTERVPVLRDGADGSPHVVYERQRVQRYVRRCR